MQVGLVHETQAPPASRMRLPAGCLSHTVGRGLQSASVQMTGLLGCEMWSLLCWLIPPKLDDMPSLLTFMPCRDILQRWAFPFAPDANWSPQGKHATTFAMSRQHVYRYWVLSCVALSACQDTTGLQVNSQSDMSTGGSASSGSYVHVHLRCFEQGSHQGQVTYWNPATACPSTPCRGLLRHTSLRWPLPWQGKRRESVKVSRDWAELCAGHRNPDRGGRSGERL